MTTNGTVRIAVASPKGGAGKTTVTLNLALAWAERGLRTLVVDLDPQGGIGHSLAKGDQELAGLWDVVSRRSGPAEAVLQTKQPALALLPRGRLDPIDTSLFEEQLGKPGPLEDTLRLIEGSFDRVLLDTPSGLGAPTRAALRVADFVLAPVQAEPLALRSLQQLLRVVEHVRERENPRLELLGMLPTMADRQKEASQSVLLSLWDGVEGVLDTVIPRVDVFAQASLQGVPVGYLGGRPSPEARRFTLLAEELDGRISTLRGQEHEERPRALL